MVNKSYYVKKLIMGSIRIAIGKRADMKLKVEYRFEGNALDYSYVFPVSENWRRGFHSCGFAEIAEHGLKWISYRLGYDETEYLIPTSFEEREDSHIFHFRINLAMRTPRLDRRLAVTQLLTDWGIFSDNKRVYYNALEEFESWRSKKAPNEIDDLKVYAFDKYLDRQADPEILEQVFKTIFREEASKADIPNSKSRVGASQIVDNK